MLVGRARCRKRKRNQGNLEENEEKDDDFHSRSVFHSLYRRSQKIPERHITTVPPSYLEYTQSPLLCHHLLLLRVLRLALFDGTICFTTAPESHQWKLVNEWGMVFWSWIPLHGNQYAKRARLEGRGASLR